MTELTIHSDVQHASISIVCFPRCLQPW